MAQFETWERETLNQFAREAREKLLNAPRWIATSEQMPERNHYEHCICNVTNGDRSWVRAAKWDGYANYFDCEIFDANDSKVVEVTHWMPMPEPPVLP